MILDKLIEFCGREENANAFRVKEIEQFVCYYLTNGLWSHVLDGGEVIGVAFARMVNSIEDLPFYWQPNKRTGRYFVIDAVVAPDQESKKQLWDSFQYILENKDPEKIFMMRHGKWKELSIDLMRRMKWEQK